MLKVEDLQWSNSHSWSLALHSFMSSTGKGTLVGAGGVSDLAEQPQRARFSARRGAHVYCLSLFDGYHHDLGRHPSSRSCVLDKKSV